MPLKPEFFSSPSAFRAWLKANHSDSDELWVGFHKKASGVSSMTWEEAVDEALCFGWIDGVRRSAADLRYLIRFSRRKPLSVWSVRNIARARELTQRGLMEPSGLAAFGRLASERSAVYSYEQRRTASLGPALVGRLRANKKAWEYFRSRSPSYQRTASWWVVSAKREETRLRRLETLIADSSHGRPIAAIPQRAHPG
ncbi:MAG TPA: YdeI/OmpD-associated family protein [Opitutaceae bacterium]|nr:YdeI/OmpD-associated family protein [Opitutaceae bacterium]